MTELCVPLCCLQVLRVRSRFETLSSSANADDSNSEGTAGADVLVPASQPGTEGLMQALQTFGVIFAVTKMVLFAIIINGPGGVNSIAQVRGKHFEECQYRLFYYLLVQKV